MLLPYANNILIILPDAFVIPPPDSPGTKAREDCVRLS